MKKITSQKTDGTSNFQRIAFIILYFGDVPWYFKFFAKSCSYNPDVDFILITDMELPGTLADNISVVKSSLAEVSKRFTVKLGFEIKIAYPYKLCDLKPAYGLVFSDLIEGYDFWGYCDIDMIFGNIRSLITAKILDSHEVITAKKDYIAGFFSLFKNNEKINNIFRQSKDYRKVFQEPVNYCFDECNWEWIALQNGQDIWELNSEIDSITHVIKRAERTGDIKAYWNTLEYHPGKISWDRGDLIYNNEKKALLCHFIYFKGLDFKHIPEWKTIPDRYYVNSFYLSGHAAGSLADRLLRSLLEARRFIKGLSNLLKQYTQWTLSYLFASRRINFNDIQHPAELAGNYKHMKLVVSVSVVDHRLNASMGGLQFPLFHKGAGKFILAKCRFNHLINIEFDFRFNEYISAYILQISGSGLMKDTFIKIS